MQRYFDTIQDVNGRAIAGAMVYVRTLAGAMAPIYSDNGVTLKDNPIRTNSLGSFDFYAADGRYTLEIRLNGVRFGEKRDILLEDPADPSAANIDGGTVKNAALQGVTIDAASKGSDGKAIPTKTELDALTDFDGEIEAESQWSDVPAHKSSDLDAQAQALANRTALLKSRVDKSVLSFPDYAAASAAAATLPDGQMVEVQDVQERYKVQGGGLGFVETIKTVLNVKDFGAIGDGVADDGPAIRAAIARIKSLGGGILNVPSGTYLVGGGNPLNAFYALSVDFSNFSIVGDSLWTTTIKVKDGGNVGPIHLSAATYFTISNITLDGNYPNNSRAGVHGLGAVDADYVNIENVRVMRSYGYGLGFQGTTETDFKFIRINGLYLENIGGDGTDFKNKAYSSKGLIISNVYVNGVGMTEPETKKAGLDIRGPATISNVHVFANGNPVIGVRFRADELTEGGNGVGGKNSSLTNFYMDLGGLGNSDGVVIDNENVSVSNGVVIGVPSGGSGVFVTSNGKYYRVNNISATASAGTTLFELAGDDGLIVNCHAFSFAGGGIGYRFNGNRPSIVSCKNFNGQYGFRRNAGAVPGTLTNCESTGATTSDYSTSLQEVPLNCNFQTSSFKSSFISAGGNRVAEFSYVDSSVNYLRFDPSIAGNPVVIRSTGADTNVDLSLIPKGTGNVRFGSHTTTADVAITGYITIKDAGGTVRKLAVIS